MPEISEQEFAEFQNLSTWLRRGLGNTSTRRKILEVQKALNPQTAVPELDEANPLHQRLDQLSEEVRAEREAREESERSRQENERLRSLQGRWGEGRNLAKKRGFSDEGVQKLEEFMEQHSIGSHEAAIPYYEQVNPPPRPAVSHGSRWDFFGPQQDAGLDLAPLFAGNDEQWLDHAVTDTLNKVRSGEIQTGR